MLFVCVLLFACVYYCLSLVVVCVCACCWRMRLVVII